MMFPSNRVRVLVSTQPVDFRKGHDGLAAIVSSALRKDHPPKMLHDARMAGLVKLRCGIVTDCGGRLRAVCQF